MRSPLVYLSLCQQAVFFKEPIVPVVSCSTMSACYATPVNQRWLLRIIVLAIIVSPLVTTSDFTSVGPIGHRVKVGDIVILRLIEYLRVNLAISLKVYSIIGHLRQVKLLLLIWDLNVLMSFITERRMSVNILITRSCEEWLSVDFRLDVIWSREYGCILLQSLISFDGLHAWLYFLINFSSLLFPFLLLVKLILDGTIKFFAALFCWYARQLLLLVVWHLWWSLGWLLLKILVNFLGHYQWLI